MFNMMVLREKCEMNYLPRLLRNNPGKNGAVRYNVQENHGLQLLQKSMKRNILTICISQLGSKSSKEVSSIFKQWLLRNIAVKNGAIIYHV